MKIYSLILALLVSLSVFAQPRVGNTGNMIISAVNQYNEGNHVKASAILQKVVEADPSNDAAWYYLALCSVAENDVEMAEVRFRKAVELDPDNFWYRYRLAGIYAMKTKKILYHGKSYKVA